MVDNSNPTNQFHPYQAPDVTPVADRELKGANWQGSLNKVRDYARQNPGKALGALAALAIGAGLMRKKSV